MSSPYFRRKLYAVEAADPESCSRHTTRDLYEAAFLFCEQQCRLIRTAREDRRLHFVFEAPNMMALRMSWHDGSGQVVGSKYADALKHLKHLAMGR